MIKRVLLIAFGTLLSMFVLAGVIWYLAFSSGPKAPRELEMEGLSSPVSVSWSPDGPVRIEAENQRDAYVGLGYGMGRSRAWQLILWRQAALGGLSSWFGNDTIEIDRLSRQLRFAEAAKSDWEVLPAESKEALERLSEGINGAIMSGDMGLDSPFLLLGVEPETWQAWHSLALERLFAWMSGHPFDSGSDASGIPGSASQVAAYRADRSLRELLQMDGFEYNTITSAVRDSSSFIAARYVTGRLAVPFFVETIMVTPQRTFSGLVVPGSFVAPLGTSYKTKRENEFRAVPAPDQPLRGTGGGSGSLAAGQETLSWAFLLRGEASVSLTRIPENELVLDHSRIDLPQQEELVTIARWNDSMPLIQTSREASSGPVTTLKWAGLSEPSDTERWLNLINGKYAEPRLVSPDGVVFEGNRRRVNLRPDTRVSENGSLVFLASSGSDKTPAERFLRLSEDIDIETLLHDTYNQAAAERMPTYMNLLPDSVLTDDMLRVGVPYLTNWNYEYEGSEIGASLFESIQKSGMNADSNLPKHVSDMFRDLSVRYGQDMSNWRWENVQERTLFFPGTTSAQPDGGRPEESFSKKFAPINVGGPGHPQTFVWGTASEGGGGGLSSAWEGALDLERAELLYRRPFIDYSAFLGSFLSSDRPIDLKRMSIQLTTRTTRLLPRTQND